MEVETHVSNSLIVDFADIIYHSPVCIRRFLSRRLSLFSDLQVANQ